MFMQRSPVRRGQIAAQYSSSAGSAWLRLCLTSFAAPGLQQDSRWADSPRALVGLFCGPGATAGREPERPPAAAPRAVSVSALFADPPRDPQAPSLTEAALNSLQPAGHLATAAGPGQYQRLLDSDQILVTLEGGRQLQVPAALVTQQADGGLYLNLPLRELQAQLMPAGARSADEQVIPVMQEELLVGVREVEQGGVRVTKTTHEQVDNVATWLRHDEVEVERVPVNEFVTEPSPPEYTPERVVIPIYEEVVVVEKRLRLKERLVLTRRQVDERAEQPVSRRVEEAIVERLPAAGSTDQNTAAQPGGD
jgi:uncharacterized protein (TIGR02271 family)